MSHPHARWAVIAATFFLLEMNDMSNHAVSFESTRIGAAPEGWTSTLTGCVYRKPYPGLSNDRIG
jgi:hypothetical protein